MLVSPYSYTALHSFSQPFHFIISSPQQLHGNRQDSSYPHSVLQVEKLRPRQRKQVVLDTTVTSNLNSLSKVLFTAVDYPGQGSPAALWGHALLCMYVCLLSPHTCFYQGMCDQAGLDPSPLSLGSLLPAPGS